jgi:hypothetical protein
MHSNLLVPYGSDQSVSYSTSFSHEKDPLRPQCLSWPRYDGEKKTLTPAPARNHVPVVHSKTDILLMSSHGSYNSDMLHTQF